MNGKDRGIGAGLLDTSIFVATQTGRPLGELPARGLVSVVTVGELQLRVFAAPDAVTRERRARTLARARSSDPLPVTEAVMGSWARLVGDCRAAGIQRAVKLTDALIAATAVEHGLPVFTQDDDFDGLARAHDALRVVRV